ncbi:MAG: dihydrolipoyl dehydrogenase [Bacteroidaceae bacterium]|nr:dihydrolipoyl dehydrogenase [Bacteroidaceae bacterium]
MKSIIIIGSGPGGYKAAAHAARHGATVTIFEADKAGGTCLNCGCIPTKALCHDAGLARAGLHVDFDAACQRKNAIVEQLRQGVEQLLAQPGITLVHARAYIKDEHTVVADGREYTADAIIIATGSRAKMPPIDGMDLPGVVTSTGLLALDSVPRRLAIIGAGVIGMEFASVFAALGARVTVLEYMRECLPTLDGDVAKRLRKQLEHEGIDFQLQAAVKAIGRSGDTLSVAYERKGRPVTVEADVVLVATGRAANVEGLGLENVGITADSRGIAVDGATMRVAGHDIWAIGDVNGRQMLAHAATFQGYRAVNDILGLTDGIRLDVMPAAVFTLPEAAGVGPTEEQLKTAATDYVCHKAFFRANGKALTMGQTEGIVKLITTPDDRLLACHVLGPHAADIVQEVAALICRDTTLAQLRDMVHIHPTLAEVLVEG